MAIQFEFKGSKFVKPEINTPKVVERVDRPDSVEGPDGTYIIAHKAVEILGLSANSLTQAITKGTVRYAKLGKFNYFNLEDITMWKEMIDEKLAAGYKKRPGRTAKAVETTEE